MSLLSQDESDIDCGNKNQTIARRSQHSEECKDSSEKSSSKVSSDDQKSTSKVSSDSCPRLPPESSIQSMKSTSHRSSASRLKQSAGTAVVSSTVLQQLNTDVCNKTAPVRKSTTAVKKPTTRYKPAHHSAPFKTTPLPPGQSKFPHVSRPGSRKMSTPPVGASHIVGAREIDRHGGRISVASSSANSTVDTRRIVRDGGRTSLATIALSDPRSSLGNVASGMDCACSRVNNAAGTANGIQADLTSCGGISESDGISGEYVTTQSQSYPCQTGLPDDYQTFSATSAVIGQQTGSASADGVAANDVSRRTEAVVQLPVVIQPNVNPLLTDETVKDNSSSFILHRDGQVTCVVETQ